MDFFDYQFEDKKYIVIGNPPFGRVSSLAIKFFNRCAEHSDLIGFIIPRTFKRISVQNKLSLNMELAFSKDLEVGCFEPNMAAKCCFQIWKRGSREKILLKTTHEDFTFLNYTKLEKKLIYPKEADFAIKNYGSNCGKVKKEMDSLSPKSWHWIKSNIEVDTLIERLESLDYSISKDTVRQDSIGKGELVKLYSEHF